MCDTCEQINMTRGQLNTSSMYETPASVNMSNIWISKHAMHEVLGSAKCR